MARIAKKSIELVKSTVKISDVFEWLGTTVMRRGKNTMAFCPFCSDFSSKNPGCSLDDVQGLYYCHVCHSSGDTISAVQQHEECSFPEAVERLAAQFGIQLEYEESADPAAESRRRKLVAALEAAQACFLEQRKDHHFADFLDQRNIDMETADRFGLGISLYTAADALVSKLLSQFDAQTLIDCGLCYADDRNGGKLVLRFRNRLMFPIRTAPGTLVAFGARDLTGKSPAKYKNSPESELFKKRTILYGMDKAKRFMNREKKAIVCEGYMDTIALQAHGYPYAVGAMGTALTASNLNRIASFADTIYISLDSDKAGVAAAMRTAETIPSGFSSEVKVLSMPEIMCNNEQEVREIAQSKAEEYLDKGFPISVPVAKDPDEFFNSAKRPKEEFDAAIEHSKDVFLFCAMKTCEKMVDEIDAEIASGSPNAARITELKASAKRAMSAFMSKIYSKTNIYQRQNVANYMIDSLRLVDTFEQLEGEWRRSSSGAVIPDRQTRVKTSFTSASTADEDAIIAALYIHPEVRGAIKKRLENINELFTSEVRASVFSKLEESCSKGIAPKDASSEMNREETAELARIVMNADKSGSAFGEEDIERICEKAEIKSLSNRIERESNAAEPDLMGIIQMKMRLAELQNAAK